jgi:hypothetical protein
MQRDEKSSEEQKMALRKRVHLIFAGIFILFVFYFKYLNNASIINVLLGGFGSEGGAAAAGGAAADRPPPAGW